jgi:hypothetical protein
MLMSIFCVQQANTIALEGVVIWAIFNGLGKHTGELNPYEFGVQFKVRFYQHLSTTQRGHLLGVCITN